MNTVKDRIIHFIKSKGFTTLGFEKSIGVSSGYIKSISKSIQPDKLEIISDLYPELNIEWLLIGKGEMLKSEQPPTVSHSGNSTSYTGNFRDVNTRIGSGTSIQGYGNAVGTGNSVGNISGSENSIIAEPETSYAQRKKAQKLGIPIPEVMELRHENEKLRAEIEHLKENLRLKDAVIQAKDELIKLLTEHK